MLLPWTEESTAAENLLLCGWFRRRYQLAEVAQKCRPRVLIRHSPHAREFPLSILDVPWHQRYWGGLSPT